MTTILTRLALGAVLAITSAASQAADPAAINFGARDNVLDVSIAPDGKSLAIVQPDGTRGAVVTIARIDGSVPPKAILSSDGNPQRVTGCRWSTAARLVCSLFTIEPLYGQLQAGTRMLVIDADGGNLKQLSARNTDRALGVALGGGNVIDWLGDDKDGSVLFERWFIPEQSTATLLASNKQGLGVERINLKTLARTMVEPPNAAADTYITDGHGVVRIMGFGRSNTMGQSRDLEEFRYRRKGSRDWLPLSTATFTNYQTKGFVPLAVDPDLDVAYGLETIDGRTGLYTIALDGSLKKTAVAAGSDHGYGIDQVVQIGRQRRVVGASWITDKRQTKMFDPELERFTASLTKTLPKAPIVSIVDASADERQLVLFAGSDDDPGRFYLYDKPTHHLTEILPVRPQLAKTALATMKPITYPAADGKPIPAYLTLPPGSDGKRLPAIVLPHGGPTYRDEWNFDWLPQYLANRGYAVIQPEFRGSSGYGTEWFKNNAIRGWKQAIGDVNDAGRWLVKQGIADPAKLAIVGWSYGGYAALQSQAVDPALFKAVVAIAPVTDWGIMKQDAIAGGRNTPASVNAVFGDASVAEEGSPARHADRFAAPVLLVTGDLDQNVPPAQSRLMAGRLKAAGKSVQFLEYKGLDHQLDDSAVRTEMLGRTDQFLRTALKM